jgi:hypothetical protein
MNEPSSPADRLAEHSGRLVLDGDRDARQQTSLRVDDFSSKLGGALLCQSGRGSEEENDEHPD